MDPLRFSTSFTLCILVLLTSATTAAQTPAYRFEVDGDVITLSGVLDGWLDRSALARAISGKRILILSHATANNLESAYELGQVIRRTQLTTVLDGDCGENCLPLFVGGAQRLWAQRPGSPAGVAILANRPPAANVTPTLTTFNPSLYLFYRDQLSGMPFSVLNGYMNSRSTRDGVRFIQPTTMQPNGQGMECKDLNDLAHCRSSDQLLPLKVGLLTSAEAYPLPAIPVRVAPASQPAVESMTVASPAPATSNEGKNAASLQAGMPLLARSVSELEGPREIGSSFNLDGRIFVYAPFFWREDGPSGAHDFETRWLRGTQPVHTSPTRSVSWSNTPGAAWYAVRAADFGPGSYTVEIWLDGMLVASKRFVIRAE